MGVSIAGWLAGSGTDALIATETYGYFAFNLFCLIANLSIAWSASRCGEFDLKHLAGLHRFARDAWRDVGDCRGAGDHGRISGLLCFPICFLIRTWSGAQVRAISVGKLLSLYLVLLAVRTETCKKRTAALCGAYGDAAYPGPWG